MVETISSTVIAIFRLSTPTESFSKPFFEFKGIGNVIFEGGFQASGDFNIKLLENGTLTGDLKFSPVDGLQLHVPAFHDSMTPFVLTGSADGWNQPIRAEECRITGYSEVIGSEPSLDCKFRARCVLVNHENSNYVPTRPLSLRFGIINVHEQYGTDVNTELGPLTFRNFQGVEEKAKIMQIYEVPMITSHISILHTPNGTDTISQIIDKADKVARNFLKIASLADTTWHEWVCVRVFEEIKEGSDSVVSRFIKIKSVKAKNPKSRGLTNPSHSITFVTTGWNNYDPTIDDRYGFDSALEWYIDSFNGGSTLEGLFINATTCLEMLMDKFHNQNKSEFLLDEEIFDDFYEHLKKNAGEWLKARGIDSDTRRALYSNLRGTRRRAYVEKAEMLVKHFGISYEDTGIGFDDIVEVRNNITHRGKYYSEKSENGGDSKFFKTYEGLFCILSRIFLSMLNYSGIYFEPTMQKWIQFDTVKNNVSKSKKEPDSSATPQ